MNEFIEMEDLPPTPPKHPQPNQSSKLHDNYHELESDWSVSHKQETNDAKVGEETQHQQVQKIGSKFKLVLPSAAEPDAAEERNNYIKPRRVLIQPPPSPLKQSTTAEKLKIYDIDDEIEEDITETKYENIPNLTQKVDILQFPPEKEQVWSEQNNSFLQVKEKVSQLPPIIKPMPVQMIPHQGLDEHEGIDQNQKSRLFTQSRIQSKEARIVKGAFYEQDSEEYAYQFRQSASKKTIDSGLQITSVHSSRDELSTRNILLPSFSEQKTKSKLTSLKPYKETFQDKLAQVPSQTLLKEEQSPQRPKSVNKKPPIPWNRQEVIIARQIPNISQFIRHPIPYGKRLQCTINRNKDTCKRFFLDYDLVATDGTFLMSCKKMAFCLNSTYNISLSNGEYDEKSDFFLAKVKGNFVGSIFNLYTYNSNSFQANEMVATIHYQFNCSCCSDNCRQLQIYLKSDEYRFYQLQGTELEEGKNLKDLYEVQSNRKLRRITKYINKQPIWYADRQMFGMNFHGKAKFASVKNTIIVEQDHPQNDLVLLAKRGSDEFVFDVCHPFSPLVAFGIMITGFDFKLATQ